MSSILTQIAGVEGVEGVRQALEESWDENGLMHADNDLSTEAEGFNEVLDVVKAASKGVTTNTYKEYLRQKNLFEAFVVEQGWIQKAESSKIVGPKPHFHTPVWIVAWIMDKCDDTTHTGSRRDSTFKRASYVYAQKMRAAMTYFYGKEQTIGNTWWHVIEDGSGYGNPSLSHTVATYMVSLRRRKTRDGEAPLSARAITPQVLQRLYKFNTVSDRWQPQQFRPTSRLNPIKETIYPAGRHILQVVYSLAFVCMMRIDEVLNLQVRHIVPEIINGELVIKLLLDFRKTNQNGGIKPFYLHRFPAEEAYLCPSRFLAEWLHFSKINEQPPHTPVFPRIAANGRLTIGSQMTSEQFLEMFRCNLIDIGIDPLAYGTHSFRRGGCQWLACDKRWPLRQICDWGGWSTEFNSLTIVKYLISENDDPRDRREDYFNPQRLPVVKCFTCGRTCSCS